MQAEPGAIDTRQLELGHGSGLRSSGGRRHFDKAQRPRGRRVRGRHLFFQVDQPQV